jgi:serine O-acetyltransferase
MVFKYIVSDYYRYTGSKISVSKFIKLYLLENGFKFQVWLRLCKSRNVFVRFISYLQWFRFSRKYALFISPKTSIGYGLYLGHGLSVVINSTAKIGNNVNIGHFTTIGSNHDKAATIGNNVYIAPNVSIIEDVDIGSDVIIGAGSVVVSDIKSGSTCVGVPARVIKKIDKNYYIKNGYYE